MNLQIWGIQTSTLGTPFTSWVYPFNGAPGSRTFKSSCWRSAHFPVPDGRLAGPKAGIEECIVISYSVQFSSVAQSCPTLCNPMNCSTPGLPVHHQLPEFTETHVHRVSDAIQPSHPLSSPSPLAPNPSQHQSLFQ